MFRIALISSLLHVCLGFSFCDLHGIFSLVVYSLYFYLQAFLGGLQGDEKYRCSETGYRIPFKCLEIKDSTKDAKKTKSQKGRLSLEISDGIAESHKVSHDAGEINPSQSHRRLVDDSLSSDNSSQAYITYRSCITPVNEEKLSLLNFEVIFSLQLTPILTVDQQLLNLVDWENKIIWCAVYYSVEQYIHIKELTCVCVVSFR